MPPDQVAVPASDLLFHLVGVCSLPKRSGHLAPVVGSAEADATPGIAGWGLRHRSGTLRVSGAAACPAFGLRRLHHLGEERALVSACGRLSDGQ